MGRVLSPKTAGREAHVNPNAAFYSGEELQCPPGQQDPAGIKQDQWGYIFSIPPSSPLYRTWRNFPTP